MNGIKERIQILKKLISAEGDPKQLETALKQFSWDEEELVSLSKRHLKNVLDKVKKKQMTLKQLEEWANVVELRDDINFETEEVLDHQDKNLHFQHL